MTLALYSQMISFILKFPFLLISSFNKKKTKKKTHHQANKQTHQNNPKSKWLVSFQVGGIKYSL